MFAPVLFYEPLQRCIDRHNEQECFIRDNGPAIMQRLQPREGFIDDSRERHLLVRVAAVSVPIGDYKTAVGERGTDDSCNMGCMVRNEQERFGDRVRLFRDRPSHGFTDPCRTRFPRENGM
jgi:hypothetical protein